MQALLKLNISSGIYTMASKDAASPEQPHHIKMVNACSRFPISCKVTVGVFVNLTTHLYHIPQ